MCKFSPSVAQSIGRIQSALRAPRNDDLITHEFRCMGAAAALLFLDGMSDREMINLSVLRPCLGAEPQDIAPADRAGYLMERVLTASGSKLVEDFDEALALMLSGRALLLTEGCAGAIVCDVPGFDKRSVSQPVTESVIIGPHEGFTENLRTDITLLRRIVRSPRLVTEMLEVGTEVRTRVALMYMDGVARASTVNEMRRRVQSLEIAAITDIGQIEQLIEDSP